MSKQEKKPGDTNPYSNKKRYYSFEEHIRRVVLDNYDYLEYVKGLYEAGLEIDRIDEDEIAGKIEPMVPAFAEAEKKVEDLKERLQESGVEVTQPIRSLYQDNYHDPIRLVDGHEYSAIQIGNHKYDDTGYKRIFNGIEITHYTLEEDGREFEEPYDKHIKEYPDIEKSLEDATKELERQEGLRRIPFMATNGRMDRIAELNERIRRLKLEIKNRSELKTKLDTYRALTPEQKGLIGDYLAAIAESRKLGRPIEEQIHEFYSIKNRNPIKDANRNRWQRAFDSALGSGKITEEQVAAFNEMIMTELSHTDVSYEDGIGSQDVSAEKSLGAEGPISWLLSGKVIEFARSEKAKLEAEQKELNSALALTEERDKVLSESGASQDIPEEKDPTEEEK